eukprot:TRINITY_DN5840_c0_g1_i3.p2 TRINITY_DN5840_c0_g1~~TRINITY_DN5840_c0_g1_i3.p2  ORF type:complete len:292 (+),score=92.44 TRINITY_DN5840_c0_g1_i3:218-1093(+)
MLRQQKKVKSMQMFRKPVNSAVQGDRLGICLPAFGADLMERGLASAVGTVPTLTAALVKVNKIRYYKQPVRAGVKWPITVGHFTVLAKPTFFALPQDSTQAAPPEGGAAQDEEFNWDAEYAHLPELLGPAQTSTQQWALLEFDLPITVPLDSKLIGARLDADTEANQCRLAFEGRLVQAIKSTAAADLACLKIFKPKSREGCVDRVMDGNTLIGKNFFNKEADMTAFLNMKMTTENGDEGTLMGPFGKTGKFKVFFPSASFNTSKEATDTPKRLMMHFRKFVYGDKNAMVQ